MGTSVHLMTAHSLPKPRARARTKHTWISARARTMPVLSAGVSFFHLFASFIWLESVCLKNALMLIPLLNFTPPSLSLYFCFLIWKSEITDNILMRNFQPLFGWKCKKITINNTTQLDDNHPEQCRNYHEVLYWEHPG